MTDLSGLGMPDLPFGNCTFVQLGSSRCGRLLAILLADQGAQPAPAEAAVIVIDDRGEPDEAGRIPAAGRVVIRLTDFPREHPRWSPRSSLVDQLIHAELGLHRMSGDEPEEEVIGLASAYGAFWGAIYVANALRMLQAGATGPIALELPLFSAALTLLGRRVISIDDPQCIDQLEQPMMPTGEIYRCADGRFVQSHGTYPHFAEAICRAAGHDELRESIAADFYSLPDKAAVEMWRVRLAAIFLERPALEWEERINAIGGSCTMCRSHEEWLHEEHARVVDIIAPAAARQDGRTVRQAVRIDRHGPAGQAKAAAPEGLPLAGIKVIDFSIILAGPTCGRTLAEFGADVIKIDQAARPFGSYTWLDANRGKRSILIELDTPRGRDLALSLIADADVVVENLRDGKLAQLGLGFEDARRVNPDIVYCSLNAFDYGGPWSGRPGWEHNGQAATGMQVAKAKDGVPRQVPVPGNDFGTGLLAAYGVLLALMQRDRGGEAVLVRGSLARTASFIQTDELVAAAAGTDCARRRTVAVKCSDGWIRVLGDEPDRAAGVDSLARIVAGRPVHEAVGLFAEGGYMAAVERRPQELLADTWMAESGLMVTWQHPQWGAMRQGIARAARSDVATRSGWPAPDPSADALTILKEAGCSPETAAALMNEGIVHPEMPLFRPAPAF